MVKFWRRSSFYLTYNYFFAVSSHGREKRNFSFSIFSFLYKNSSFINGTPSLCCSVAQSCPTLCNPMGCSTEGFPVFHYLLELTQLMSIELVMSSNHLILCHPLLLLTSIFLNIRVFPNESALHIRWPKFWSFSFSISPSNEYSGLISFRIDWFNARRSNQSSKTNYLPRPHL